MPLPVHSHAGTPTVAGVNGAGTRIFDLSVIIRIRRGSAVYDLVTAIHQRARAAGVLVHILPPTQMHVTLINPIFTMAGQTGAVLPNAVDAAELYETLLAALRRKPAQTILDGLRGRCLLFSDMCVGPRDIRVRGALSAIRDAQLRLAEILKGVDGRFDHAEGHPLLHVTVLRYLPGVSAADYSTLHDLVAEAVAHCPAVLSYSMRPGDFVAVRFDRLFQPWVAAARAPHFAFPGSG